MLTAYRATLHPATSIESYKAMEGPQIRAQQIYGGKR